MDKDDKKEGLFKRLENIKNKNEEQLQTIKDQGEKQLKEPKNIDRSKTLKAIDEIRKKNNEANKLLPIYKKIDRILDISELVSTKTGGTKYNFNRFALPLNFVEKSHNYEIILDEVIEEQTELRNLINKTNEYGPRIPKNRALDSARELTDARDNLIDLFKKVTFPYKDNAFKTKEKESEEESDENKLEKIKDNYNKNFRYTEDDSIGINYDLFKDYFYSSVPSALVKRLYETKDEKKNNELLELIKIRWSNLKDEIEKMSKKEIENDKSDKILKIVKSIIEFKKQKQLRLGLKTHTANQMLSRLPITLAQLKAGNNSKKLKNELRQILYSLYTSRKLTKQLYKSLIDII